MSALASPLARLPVLFISHGGPPTLFDTASPVYKYWKQVGDRIRTVWNPRAVLFVSAHWERSPVAVLATDAATTYHDHGFPDIMRYRYTAPGSLAVAQEVQQALTTAGLECVLDTTRGRDHGVWVPAGVMLPDTHIPVLQVSLPTSSDPAEHFALGRALEPLRDRGILIIGSGGATHNLRVAFSQSSDAIPDFSRGFDEWLSNVLAIEDDSARLAALQQWQRSPHARMAHPTPEHFHPLLVVAAAAHGAARRVVDAFQLGLSMASYEWDR